MSDVEEVYIEDNLERARNEMLSAASRLVQAFIAGADASGDADVQLAKLQAEKALECLENARAGLP